VLEEGVKAGGGEVVLLAARGEGHRAGGDEEAHGSAVLRSHPLRVGTERGEGGGPDRGAQDRLLLRRERPGSAEVVLPSRLPGRPSLPPSSCAAAGADFQGPAASVGQSGRVDLDGEVQPLAQGAIQRLRAQGRRERRETGTAPPPRTRMTFRPRTQEDHGPRVRSPP
jgi:hypothetical protein